MTDGIGRLSGYGGYNIGGYMSPKNDDVNKNGADVQPAVVNNYEDTQIDPAKVMEFMANNKIFVAPPKVEVDPATQERVDGYMEQFEMIYGVILEEFGEELAPLVMNMVMDNLMGVTE